MPTIPTGASISNANFAVTETIPVSSAPTGDLYGIRISSSDSILASDYQTGTDLQPGYAPATSSGASLTTSVAGSAALSAFIQANYVAGDYIFIGLKLQPINESLDQLVLGRFGFGGSPPSTDATLTFTASVPEPSSIVDLCGLGAMGLFIAARRRRKA